MPMNQKFTLMISYHTLGNGQQTILNLTELIKLEEEFKPILQLLVKEKNLKSPKIKILDQF